MFAIRRAVARSITSATLRNVAPQAVTRGRVTCLPIATPSRYFSLIRPRFAEQQEPSQEQPSAEEMKEVREESVLDPEIAQSSQQKSSSAQEHAATSETTDQLPHDAYTAETGKNTDISQQQAAATSESTDMGGQVYVGNLFFEVQSAQLTEVFSQIGEVLEARVLVDGRGLSRGFGFVKFATRDEAERAVQEFNEKPLYGRRAVVNIAKGRAPAFTGRPQNDRPRNAPSKTLYIGNMSYQMSDRDLNDLFRDCKDVLDVRVAIDRRTGQPRGFAHADFQTVAAAEKAAAQLEKKEIYGRRLKIDYTSPSTLTPRSE